MASGDFLMPAPRYYSHQALYPGTWDPRCSPQFPLGNFWPVYLGNFWCDLYPEHATRVQEYFASKGLLVRMVFGRNLKDDPHFKYQRIYHLYDFLVYFVRQKDAEDAISYCHREMYYGHRLNVFPGRKPISFNPSTSVKHTLLQEEKMGLTEQVFEEHIYKISSARIDCVVMHSQKDILVQYDTVEDRNNAIRKCRLCMPDKIFDAQAKQRFLEQDVMQELYQRIQMDPYFLSMLPPPYVRNALFNGARLAIGDHWRTVNKLKMPNLQIRTRTGSTVHQKIQQTCKQARRVFGVKCDFGAQKDRLQRRMKHLQQRYLGKTDASGSAIN